MKLNYREKVILSVLLVIVIGVLGFFLLIKPKNEDIKTHDATRTETQQKWDEIYSRISQIPNLQDSIKTTVSDSKTVTDHFIAVDKLDNPRKIDQYMQKYANDCDVKISTLAVGDLSETPISYYYEAPKGARSLMVAADINGDMQAKLAEENKESNYVAARSTGSALAAQYGVTVTGSKENIWKFMKQIEDDPKTMIINSVSISNYDFTDDLSEEQLAKFDEAKEKGEEFKVAEGEEPGTSTVNFVITLYSLYEMPEANTK